jgi:thiol-disulfide isomerase/thioredoxin
MTTAVVILVVLLAAATAFGLWRRRTDGRLRTIRPDAARPEAVRLGPADGIDLGPRATLVEFSTAFCQPCRATRRILAEVADTVPGVAVVEVDAESNLDLVRRLGVMRTPTVLVLDASGVIRSRAVGLPRKAEVVAAVGAAVEGP